MHSVASLNNIYLASNEAFFYNFHMVKKLFLITLFISTTFTSFQAKADMDPRVKIVALNAGYGTVGGALLGTAAMAFGSSGRSVAIGASLGLYAGLIFGGYIVGSHEYRKNNRMQPSQENYYYPDTNDSPYQDSRFQGGGYNYQGSINQDGFSLEGPAEIGFKQERPGQDFYVNLLNYQF